MIKELVLLIFIISQGLCSLTQDLPSLNKNTDVDTSDPAFIWIVVIVTMNTIVFVLIVGCTCCNNRNRVNINLAQPRQTQGERYPHLVFKTNTYCLIESESFKGLECYQRGQVICSLPAFIHGRELRAEDHQLGLLRLRQCERCQGLTATAQIFKYGKLRQCWQVLFMLIISPLFLTFTIKMLFTNSYLWQKFFCAECGQQKRLKQ